MLTSKSFTKKTIFVSVTNAMAGKTPGVVPGETPLEDMARGCWLLNLNKAKQCEWLMAVDKDVICGMWEITSPWRNVTKGEFSTRQLTAIDLRRNCCDVCDVSDSVSTPFLNQHMSSIVGLGQMCGPVRYSF